MRSLPRPAVAAFVLGSLAVLVASAEASGQPQPVAVAGHVVLVELFTSQGCSSCPPADQLLTQLGQSANGAVVPLAYHVDFWNHGGWTDPFSSGAWTRRQAAYEPRLGLSNVYTPQAVVDGAADVIGSKGENLREAIAAAAARPAARVALQLETAGRKVTVETDVDLPEALRGRKWDLMVALFETGLVTPIKGGENGGRSLQNDYVVRALDRAARVRASGREKSTLSLDDKWDRARLGVAAFLQDPDTLEVRGAAARLLSAP